MVDGVTFVGALKWVLLVVQRPLSNLECISTPSVTSLNATCSIREKNIEKRVGARTQPCFVPVVTSNAGELSLPSQTVAFMFSWKELISLTKGFGHPIFSRMHHRPFLSIVSKALVRSMNNR